MMKKNTKQSGFTPYHFLLKMVGSRLRYPIRSTGKSGAGFTLIELIIYLAIVSIILVSVSYLMIDILDGQTRNYTNIDVNQQMRFISNIVARDIRSAQDVGSINSDNLVLIMLGDDIIFNFDTINKVLTRQVGSNDPINLHDASLEVVGHFTDLSYLNKSKNIQVSLSLNYLNPENRVEYNASSTGIFVAELRGRK